MIGLLGPVVATVGGIDRTPGAPRQRAVLACLAVNAGQPVSADQLLDAVWGEDLPSSGARAVAFHMSKLRNALEPQRSGAGTLITTSTAGYVLEIDRELVDVHRFDRLVAAAREMLPADPERSHRTIDEALALWRGRPLADVPDGPFVDHEVRRCDERLLIARRTRAEAQLACGLHAEVVADLEALIEERPLEESLVGLLMTALSRSGRTADALREFGQLRVRLGTELGIEPSNELRLLERRLLERAEDVEVGTATTSRGPPEGRVPQPAGTITFVFTDIEGSTKLLKRWPDVALDLFERHDDLLRTAWRAHRGYEVGTEGDSFFVAFDDTDDALAACAHAQRLCHEEPWPVDGGLQVRMGVHAGPALQRNDNFVGLAIHQAARVSAAANGGQVLVSDAAARRASAHHAPRLARLGRFRLRDFDEPELLYRLDTDGVEVDERPVRARPGDGHNLVRHATSFFGRETAVAEITSLLGPGATVSLVGPGGIGKTRLATEAVYGVVDEWADGVWLVDLADLLDSTLVADAIAAAIGAPSGDSNDRWEDVIGHLQDRAALLFVDNTETHVDACARVLPELLAKCPNVGLITTGREPLHVAGETIYRVAPLAVPAAADDLASIERAAAVQLFCDRARAAHPAFVLDDASAPAVARICARLDGLPLALEIAGARVGLLSLDEIVAGLDDRFRLLRSRSRTLPERQRTMRALLDWSYRLLDGDERLALRRLAIFGGTFSTDAAAAALAADDLPSDSVPELVWALVEKSLVVADLTDSETRYRLLESVRHYAAGHLESAGEMPAVAARLAAWLLEQAGPWLPADRQWHGRVRVELPNLRVLVDDLADDDPETAQQLACSIGGYHAAVKSLATGIEELRAAVETLPAPTRTRVVLLTALADLHLRTADVEAAGALLQDAAALQSELGAPDWADAAVERTRGELALRQGDLAEAEAIARSALDGELSVRGRARMWSLLGVARYSVGDIGAAAEAFRSELDSYRDLGDDAKIASAHGNLAEVSIHLGDRVAAADHQFRCLSLALALDMPVMLAYSCFLAARLAGEDGDWAVAAQLHTAAEEGLRLSGQELYAADREAADRFLADARAALGDERFAETIASGEVLVLTDAAAVAGAVLSAAAGRRPRDTESR